LRAPRAGASLDLLHLGAAEPRTALPPVFACWRDFAGAFVAALCALPDLEERRERADPAPREGELERLAAAAPPMPGGEYLTAEVLGSLWQDVLGAWRAEIAATTGTVQEWLAAKDPAWSVVGRVHLHLAENRRDPERPFAFLATYSTGLAANGKPQHRPLGDAVREASSAADRRRLLALLQPVHRASERSALVKALADSGRLFHPQAWTPAEAHRFLRDVPSLEESGVVVRVPDWWSGRRPPRPRVTVSVGERKPAALGLEAMLDFSVRLTLGDEEEGVRWLWLLSRLGLGGCLADDMGLGKTVQVLALLLLLKRHRAIPGPHLLVDLQPSLPVARRRRLRARREREVRAARRDRRGGRLAPGEGPRLHAVPRDDGAARALPRGGVRARWKAVRRVCAGQIGTVVELLAGKFSSAVMEVLCHRQKGLFPGTREIAMSCSCPDGAWLCKHLAAVLYGVGARLDHAPELLFTLRGVDGAELVAAAGKAGALASAAPADGAIGGEHLAEIFGIEMETPAPAAAAKAAKRPRRAVNQPARRRSRATAGRDGGKRAPNAVRARAAR